VNEYAVVQAYIDTTLNIRHSISAPIGTKRTLFRLRSIL
jgi:hypothetical protein